MLRAALAYIHSAPFVIRKYTKGFDVSEAPTFDEQGRYAFMEAIAKARIYLEYGCGGSTVQASRIVPIVVSVESDPVYLRSVKKLAEPGVHFISPDIGITREWGFPVNANPTRARVRRWKNTRKPLGIFLVIEFPMSC